MVVFPNAINTTLTGKITETRTDVPISYSLVEVLKDEIVVGSSMADEEGNYIIPNLISGSYTIYASAFSYESKITTVGIIPNQSTIVNLELKNDNIAVNLTWIGYSSPLGSDKGWCGGSYLWQIVDDKRSYPG